MEDIAALQKRIVSLESRLADYDPRVSPPAPTFMQDLGIWWRAEYCITSETYTAGTDWDTIVFDISTNNILRVRLPSVSGCVEAGMFGNNYGRRLRFAFWSEQRFEFKGLLVGSFGRVQIKGTSMAMTEYTANTEITFQAAEGLNWLQISANDATDQLWFLTNVLSVPFVEFRDPYGIDDFNYERTSGSGGTGGLTSVETSAGSTGS